MTTTLAPNTPTRNVGRNTPAVPRRMPPEVFDALRAITGHGPSRVYDDVRDNVKRRIMDTPGLDNGPARARTHLEVIWRMSFTDTIRDWTGRDPETITVGGSALAHELARIATDKHFGFPTDHGRRARRAVNAWLARALASQTA